MLKCRNVQGVLAASLYEPPEAGEQRELREHLDSCADCLAQYEQLRALVEAVPQSPIVFEGNLLPAIREELHPRSRSFWRLGQASLASLFVVVVVGLIAYRAGSRNEAVVPAAPEAVVFVADRVLDNVRERLRMEDHVGAMALLDTALAQATDSTAAGQMQLAKANLEFDVLHRYEEAFAEYRVLRENYGEVWAASDPMVKERFDLLTEAHEDGFEALYQIDSAISQGDGGMPVLEQVMARYPGRQLARTAMETMVAMVDAEGVQALEAVRLRCTNPLALAQLDVHLGERYVVEDRDPARGHALLQDIAGSDLEVPAQMARAVLARLEPAGK